MKKLWMVIPALFVLAGMVLTGCGNGSTKSTDDPTDITWTAEADGAGDETNTGTADTTKITITFSANVTTLRGQDVVLSGPVTQGAVAKGAGNTWDVAVTPTGSGDVSVTINAEGIEKFGKKDATTAPFVPVWKIGSVKEIGYTVVADGASDVTTSTKLTFTFAEAPPDFAATDITIAAGTGEATTGTLSGTGLTRELTITVVKQGAVQVKITKTGIASDFKPVTVYKEVPAYTVKEALAFEDGAPDVDENPTWDFDAAAITAIRAAEDAKTGHKIRLYFTIVPGKEDYGIGTIGVTDGNVFNLKAPKPYNAPTGAEYTFYVDMWVSWVLAALDDEGEDAVLTVLAYKDHQAVLVGADLLEPPAAVTPDEIPGAPEESASVAIPEWTLVRKIVTTSGSGLGDLAIGKGWIDGDDYAAIEDAVDESEFSLLRFYFRLTPPYDDRDSWGIAQVGTNGSGVNLSGKTANAAHEFYVDVKAADILAVSGVTTAGKIYVNAYGNGAVITLCELWKPPAGYQPPATHDFNLTLAVNGTWGHQGKFNAPDWMLEALGGRITQGVVYKVTFDVEADPTPGYLNLSLVDNGPDNNNYTWTPLASPDSGVYPIGTPGSPTTVTATFNPASATSSGTQGQANLLSIETGSEVLDTIPGPIELTITNFVLEIVD